MRLFKEIGKYIGLIGAFVVALILYKIINNFSYFMNFFSTIVGIISPFIYAFVIAYLLNPIVNFFTRKFNIKNAYSIFITFTIIISLFVILFLYLIPKLMSSFTDLYQSLPTVFNQIEQLFTSIQSNEHLKNDAFISSLLSNDMSSILSSIQDTLTSVSNYILKHTISTTVLLSKWILGFLISIYVLFYKNQLLKFFNKITHLLFSEKYAGKLINFFKTLDSMIMLYIVVKGLTSLLIGGIALVGLTLIGSPYAILIALFVTVTNMIPYFGPFLGIVFGVIINLIFLPSKTIFTLIFLFLLQQFDGWYLYPKTVGTKVGLNPIVVIFSVMLGGGLYGPVGMVLAVPIVATIMIYFNRFMSDTSIETK